jgi:hypothetical protein
MSSILRGILQENSKRTVKSVADEIASYIGDSPSDSAIVDAVEHEAKIHGFDPSKLFDAVYDHFRHHIDENLHKWFKEKWVRFGPDGKIRGDCARGSSSEGKPKCLPQAKAHSIGKKGRKYAGAKKRREDPNPDRSGPAKNVATKKKTNEDKKPEFMKSGNMKPLTASGKEVPGSVAKLEKLLLKAKEKGIKLDDYDTINEIMEFVSKKHHITGDELHNQFVAKHHMIPDKWIAKQKLDEKWSAKYKSSINCSHPKGFSQKAHCAGKKKHNESIEMEMVCEDCGMCETHGDHTRDTLDEACWKGYHKKGMKTMFGKKYPNCVKNTNEEQDVTEEKCPECGGPMYHESMINEKQDACYRKVKSRYKVWPSAYASGALVQCRKKGAANWGNGGKKNESSIMKGLVDEAANPAQQAAIAINMKKHGKKPTDVDEARQEQGQRRYKAKPAGQLDEASMYDVVGPLIREFNLEHGGSERWSHIVPLHSVASTKRWRRGDGSYYTDPNSIEAFDQSNPEQRQLQSEFYDWLIQKPGVKNIGEVSGEFRTDRYAEAAKYKGVIFVKRGYATQYFTPSKLRNSNVWDKKNDNSLKKAPKQQNTTWEPLSDSSIMKGLSR